MSDLDITAETLAAKGHEAGRRGDLMASLSAWALFCALYPFRHEGYLYAGDALWRLRHYRAADDILMRGIERFADNEQIHLNHAWAAADERNWADAARRFSVALERFPASTTARFGVAMAHRELGRPEEAEAVLEQGGAAQESDPPSLEMLADLAKSLGKFDVALARWRALLTLKPDDPDPYLGFLDCLRTAGRDEEAEQALQTAIRLFPSESRLVEEAGLAPSNSDSGTRSDIRPEGVPTAMRQAEMPVEADATPAPAVIRGALDAFQAPGTLSGWAADVASHQRPLAIRVLLGNQEIAAGRTSHHRGDVAWAHDNVAGFRIDSPVTVNADDIIENRIVVQAEGRAISIYPGLKEFLRGAQYIEGMIVDAPRPVQAGQPAQDKRVRRDLLTGVPATPQTYAGAAAALRKLGRLDDEDELLTIAAQRFPQNRDMLVAYARSAHRRSAWPEALERWQQVIAKFPGSADGVFGACDALQQSGRSNQAEEMLAEAVQRLPTNAALAIKYAQMARARRDWPEAIERWKAAARRFPDNKDIQLEQGRTLYLQKLEAIDQSGDSRTADAPVGQRPADVAQTPRDLMMRFESLGSGCEFGLVQRHFEAEPLGLLRWGGIPAFALARALADRFEGFADPANVKLSASDDNRAYEFRDTKYSLEMHTFLPLDDAQHEAILKRLCRRAIYLKDKLLNDLENLADFGKIFVYKRHTGALSNEEAFALYSAIRCYGDHTLLCVRPEEQQHPNGTVVAYAEGLLFGYVDKLCATNNRQLIRYESWFTVCRNAYQIWQEHFPPRSKSAAC